MARLPAASAQLPIRGLSAQNRATSLRLRKVLQALAVLLLLIVAQQGAVVHELSHASGAYDRALGARPDGTGHTTCALCPAFAQVITPAFSYSFQVLQVVFFAEDHILERLHPAIDRAVPRARSRGPPSVS